MRKTPFMAMLVLLFVSTQAFAAAYMTCTLKNGGFESNTSYAIDIYANAEAYPNGDIPFALGETFLTITYNDAVLSNPFILEANPSLQAGYDLDLNPAAGLSSTNTQLHINPTVTPDFLIPGGEVRLARIGFTIDSTAAGQGQTAGIAWIDNPNYTKSAGVILFVSGSDDSALLCAPLIGGTPDTMAPVGQPYAFTPTASDVCGAGLLVFDIANQPPWAAFDSATGELSGTPAFSDVATYGDITITVIDGDGRSSSLAPFDIDVGCPAGGPVISGTPVTSIAAGNPYSFTPTVIDGCGDLEFIITSQPAWAGFDASTGALTGTPALADVGTTSGIVISVTDQNGGGSSLSPFGIEVTPGCAAPVISGTPAASIASGSNYSFVPTVSNGCGTLTYSIVNKPDWAAFDTATGALSGTPAATDAGTYSDIQITVTDELHALSSLAAFDIQVSNAESSSSNSSGESGGGGGGGGCFISALQ